MCSLHCLLRCDPTPSPLPSGWPPEATEPAEVSLDPSEASQGLGTPVLSQQSPTGMAASQAQSGSPRAFEESTLIKSQSGQRADGTQ